MKFNIKKFNVIIFTCDRSIGNDGFITFKNVNNNTLGIERMEKYINATYPKWKFYTKYYKDGTKQLIKNINNK